MTAVSKAYERRKDPRSPTHSERLKALSDESERIRKQHREGKIDSQEASRQLDKLIRQNSHFWDPLL